MSNSPLTSASVSAAARSAAQNPGGGPGLDVGAAAKPGLPGAAAALRTAVNKRVRVAMGDKTDGVVPVVRLEGPIAATNARAVLNLRSLETRLRKAFETEDAVAVALAINCPGGSPAQSELIAARIRQLGDKHKLPVLAFCEDVAASGGYWLACAADEIFTATTSILGSIGVISSGFGAKDALERLGLERRVFTAGESKHRLDLFEDLKDEDVEWLLRLQKQLHEVFVAWVTDRRGDKLADDPTLFTGEIFVGQQAVTVGLADGVGPLRSVLADRYPNAKILPVVQPKPLLARLTSGVGFEDVAGSVLRSTLREIDSRAAWARFGI